MALAELLDRLRGDEACLLRESALGVTVSRLSVDSARQIATACAVMPWEAPIYDSEGTEWPSEGLTEALAPYRIEIRKPVAPEGELLLLTNSAFTQWLA